MVVAALFVDGGGERDFSREGARVVVVMGEADLVRGEVGIAVMTEEGARGERGEEEEAAAAAADTARLVGDVGTAVVVAVVDMTAEAGETEEEVDAAAAAARFSSIIRFLRSPNMANVLENLLGCSEGKDPAVVF